MHEFIDFVSKFPPVTMPVILGEDTHFTFSAENVPLPESLIEQFILPNDPLPPDEFTEYVPCFAIDCDEPYIALVWWKAGLLNYEYYLATFTEKGEFIQMKVIAGTRVQDQQIHRMVATIGEELNIVIVEGAADRDDSFDAEASKTIRYEILPDGMLTKVAF
jgi:hypothetical protein